MVGLAACCFSAVLVLLDPAGVSHGTKICKKYSTKCSRSFVGSISTGESTTGASNATANFVRMVPAPVYAAPMAPPAHVVYQPLAQPSFDVQSFSTAPVRQLPVAALQPSFDMSAMAMPPQLPPPMAGQSIDVGPNVYYV